jgi:quinoprotein glucose dehydrogenase
MAGSFSPARAGWYAFILGIVFALIGVVLTIGGVWLIAVGGNWYYALAGIGLIASGVLMCDGRALGVWVYLGVFIATVIWALLEVGLDGWGLLPRVFAPFVLLVLAIPTLNRLQPRAPKFPLRGYGELAIFAVLLCAGVYLNSQHKVLAHVPDAQGSFVYDSLNTGDKADWTSYGGGPAQQRYSDLTQINASNVGKLQRAWVFHTGEFPKHYGAEMTPLKIGDRLYGCTGMDQVFALDARTGKQIWRYNPGVDKEHIPYTAACRGVSYYQVPGAAPGTPCVARIFVGTLDGRILAVDAADGKPCAGFGQNGQVSITDGMGKVIPGMVAITSAPVIVQGVVVTGHQVLDGQYRWAPSGAIHGFDAVTGQLKFVWDVMQPNLPAVPPAGTQLTPGTPNMWTTATGDEQLGLVYLPMGNSAADYYSSTRRPEEKRASSALVALDVHTGKPRWVFQTVHNDVWDYDLGSQPTLIDYPTAGGMVPAVVLPSKTGEIYILDRRTGKPLTRTGQVKAPSGGVEPSERAPYQPVSGFATVRKPDLKETDMWGMSPIDQMICRIQYHMYSYKGFFTPPTLDRYFIEYPGYNGGSDWGSAAVDPRRGVLVVNYNDMPNAAKLITRKEADRMGIYGHGDPRNTVDPKGEDKGAQEGVPYADIVNAGWRMPGTGLLCKEPPYGGIRAIDLKTGQTLWDRPLGKALRNGPFGIPSMLPIDIGTPNNGGSVVTAGGLIFVAAATDDLIRAIDIRTGKTVWTDKLPAGGQATPMVYEQGGREYLVIMAGGHHFMETPAGDALIAYALPQS